MHSKLVLSCALACAAASAPLPAQVAQNMVLESRVPTEGCGAADVWALGPYMLMARQSQGFSVTDLRDPRNPVTKVFQPPGYPRPHKSIGVSDIKADSRYLYVGDNITGAGVFIYDTVPDPMNPTLLSKTLDAGVPLAAHNLWIDGDYLYVQNVIFDVSNRRAPVHVHTIQSPSFTYTHDVTVKNGRAYLANWHNGFAIYDVSNPRLPLLLANHTYAGMRTHNLWPTDDGRYLFSTDELPDGHVRVWDISNLSAIRQVGEYRSGPPGSVVHNVVVHDDLLFVAYYKEGLRVCSIRDPANPAEIAYYDTYAPLTNGCHGDFTAGAWGVYPWRKDVVLVGDADSGGYILRLNPIAQVFAARSPVVSPGSAIELDFAYRNDAPAALEGFGVMLLASANGSPVFWPVVVEASLLAPQQAVSHAVRIPLPAGLPVPISLGFEGYTGIATPLLLSERVQVAVQVR